MIGKIGALLGGPWGTIIGGAYFGIQAYQSYLDSQSPYPYYITSTYIHLSQKNGSLSLNSIETQTILGM